MLTLNRTSGFYVRKIISAKVRQAEAVEQLILLPSLNVTTLTYKIQSDFSP
jgi:hypothetical protein